MQRPIVPQPSSPADEDVVTLRRRFDKLVGRSRTVLADPRLKRPELAPLNRHALDALAVLKLVRSQLQQPGTSAEPDVAWSDIARLLELSGKQHERIAQQLKLLDHLDAWCDQMRQAVAELGGAETCGAGRFENLARQVLLEVRQTPDAPLLMPEPGLACADYLAGSHGSAGRVFATGLLAARLMAWTAGHFEVWSGRLELLTVAALLQDVGRLAGPGRLPGSERQHPVLGAAWAGGIRDYSVALPRLIADHHERLDGTGFPRGLRGRSLPHDSRLMAVVTRYVELACGVGRDGKAAGGKPATGRQAALQVHREAARGEFDLPLTLALMKCLDVTPPADAEGESPAVCPFAASRFGSRRWRLDERESAQGPHARIAAGREQTSLDGPNFARRSGRTVR